MSIQLIIIQVITFIAVIVVLKMLFSTQLNSALSRLNKLHEENLIKEEELVKQLEEAKQEKEREIKKARDEAAAIIKEAKARAEKSSMEYESKSKDEAQKKFEHVEGEIEKIKTSAAMASHEQAVELSVRMLEAIFTEQGKESLQREMMNELLEEIKNLDKTKFTVKTKDVDVISASPMDADSRSKLVKILSDKLGMHVETKESVEKALIAGLIIKIGALTIDGSLKNKLRKVLPHLK